MQLANANKLMQQGKNQAAAASYLEIISDSEILSDSIRFNLSLALRRLAKDLQSSHAESIFIDSVLKIIQASQKSKNNFDLNGIAQSLIAASSITDVKEDRLFSIIMPTWNRAEIIHEAISSVLAQTYRNWELIVCDDASEDNTEQVVKEFCDTRVNYLKVKKGNGAIARNHGLRAMTGEIVAFLDSDNIWSPIYLREVVRRYHEGCLATYSGFIDSALEVSNYISVETKFKSFDYSALAYKNYIDLNTVTIDSRLINRLGGFDPCLPRQQDWDLLLRYFANTTPVGIDLPLVLYRRNPAWNQVTITKKNIDTRSVVMAKNAKLNEQVKNGKLPNKVMLNRIEVAPHIKRTRSIAIKISAPTELISHEWGDFHFAHHLGAALHQYGFSYRVDCQDKWYEENADDVVLVLRGRHRFLPNRSLSKCHLLWLISHPDRLAQGELDDFQHIFVASEIFCKKVRRATKVPASTLHQATDPQLFKPLASKIPLESEIIFVGNSRNQYRKIVQWAIEAELNFRIWGNGWDEFVPKHYIIDKHILNGDLFLYYSSCKILLNDHWDTMANNGFISNRIFDGAAAGAFIITDEVKGLSQLFGDAIQTVNSPLDLKDKVDYFLRHQEVLVERKDRAREIVLSSHTFNDRAAEIAETIDNLSLSTPFELSVN